MTTTTMISIRVKPRARRGRAVRMESILGFQKGDGWAVGGHAGATLKALDHNKGFRFL